jgi:predicted alpha/beta hydrolase family esterase
MTNAIILHGTTSKQDYYAADTASLSNRHWLPWLQNQLLIRDIAAATPDVPRAHVLDYETWCREVERFAIGPDTMLVGHSCGGGFWVRYLSERANVHVGKVVLVAPWLDPDNSKQSDFFEFTIDPAVASRTAGMVMFHSDNDMGTVQQSVARLRQEIEGLEYREFHQHGHFLRSDLATNQFPELLIELVG